METQSASHPPADVLLALGAGKLDDATAEAIFFPCGSLPRVPENRRPADRRQLPRQAPRRARRQQRPDAKQRSFYLSACR